MTVDELLTEARAGLTRVDAPTAADEQRAGALLVDTRPRAQRRAEGGVPGALVIERNVLEWRLDPASPARIPQARDHGVRIIVLCSEGYSSSLAAASLQRLGLHRATDLAGGVRAWAEAGLPLTRE